MPCVLIFCNALTNTKTTFVFVCREKCHKCETLEHNSKQMWAPLGRFQYTSMYVNMNFQFVIENWVMNVQKREIYTHSFSGFSLLNYNFPNVFDLLSGKFCLIFFCDALFIIQNFPHFLCVWFFLLFFLFAFIFHANQMSLLCFWCFTTTTKMTLIVLMKKTWRQKTYKNTYVLHTKCIIFNIKMKCLSNDVLMG